MIASLKGKTGRTLEEWRLLIAQKRLLKHGEIMAFLKGEHGLSHGFANQIALRSRPEDVSAPSDADPIEAMFAKKELARKIYDAVLAHIDGFRSDVDLAPKKAYVSLRRSKQFAILQPAANRLDVGINLKGTEPTGRLEPSGSFNAMLSHRVKVGSVEDVDAELIAWLREAYGQA